MVAKRFSMRIDVAGFEHEQRKPCHMTKLWFFYHAAIDRKLIDATYETL